VRGDDPTLDDDSTFEPGHFRVRGSTAAPRRTAPRGL